MPMYVFLLPPSDTQKVSAADSLIHIGNILLHPVEKLGSKKISQSIGWEITDGAHRPMDILEYSIGIRGRTDSQQLLHQVVPGLWQVFYLQLPVYQGQLQLKAQNYMQT